MKIAVAAFEGVDELDVVGPLEVLRRAARLDERLDVALVTLGPAPEVTGQFGLRMRVDGVLAECGLDVLVVPGGGWASESPQGVRSELERGIFPARIAALFESGCLIASVCTGALLVAASGIAQGRRMTTHASALAELERFGVHVVHERVVDDGTIVSGGGVTSGIDLALHLADRFCGQEIAGRIARSIEIAHPAPLGPN